MLMVVKMKKEYECYICGKNPCRFTVEMNGEEIAIPEECPFHNDCNFKAKWIEKSGNSHE